MENTFVNIFQSSKVWATNIQFSHQRLTEVYEVAKELFSKVLETKYYCSFVLKFNTHVYWASVIVPVSH